MGVFPIVLLAAASAYTVIEDGYPLRRSCEPGDTEVARLKKGEPVTIRFAMNGEYGACYKVAVESGGKSIEGWMPASALRGLDAFDKERQSAQTADSVQAERQDIRALQQQAVDKIGVRTANEQVLKATRLLEANQPEEALKNLEAALKANRRDAGVLALAGLAAYQSDQVKAAVDYFKESLELAPSPAVDRMLTRAQREAQEDQSSAKLVGMRFLLRYDPKEVTADQARSIVPVLDHEFGRVSEALGCRSEERIVAVLQGLEAYRKTTGAAEWSGGRYDGRIRVALLEPQPGPKTRQAFAHEIVHACLARTGNWPAWLHEGLAQKLSGEMAPPAQRAAVQAMAKGGQLPPLGKLTDSWSRMSAEHAAAAYTVALVAADTLYASHGPDGVRSLLQSPERLEQVTADLDRRLRE
jgi:tetratricopeptide (TPR) repeat protein